MRTFVLSFLLVWFLFGSSQNRQLPDGFVDVRKEIPNISVELRYCSVHNFIGDTIHGYTNNRLILSQEATEQLKKVQHELNTKGLGLRVYDAYRPQMAVNHFMKWARELSDTLMKAEFYPKVHKRDLFKEGYIASKSGHSRGSTVDLTIIVLKTGEVLDMGSPYDFFGPQSWVDFDKITEHQKANRKLLQELMNKYNFRGYSKEWWHFTLRNEPHTDTYFNFPIE